VIGEAANNGKPGKRSAAVFSPDRSMVPSALAVEASPEIQFSVSDASALHMEDTTPLAISSAGTPATVAAPVRGLWQTDAKAIRLIFEVDYKWRAPGAIAWITSVGW
jgi:hypothetical protein